MMHQHQCPCRVSGLMSSLLNPLSRFCSAALHPLLVHGGAPGHAGRQGRRGAAQLLGPQRRSHAGADRVEERRHLHEPGFRREAAHPARRDAVLQPRGPLQAQQAGRGHLPVRRHHRQPGLHLQPDGAPLCSR